MVDGVKIVAEKEIAYVFENAKIVYRKGMFGNKFDVVTSSASSCRS